MKYTIEIRRQNKPLDIFMTTDKEEFYSKMDELFDKRRKDLENDGFKEADVYCNDRTKVVVYYHRGRNEATALSMQVIQDTELKDVRGNEVCIQDKIAFVGEDGKLRAPVYEVGITGAGELYLFRVDRRGPLEYDVTQTLISKYRRIDETTVENLKLKGLKENEAE